VRRAGGGGSKRRRRQLTGQPVWSVWRSPPARRARGPRVPTGTLPAIKQNNKQNSLAHSYKFDLCTRPNRTLIRIRASQADSSDAGAARTESNRAGERRNNRLIKSSITLLLFPSGCNCAPAAPFDIYSGMNECFIIKSATHSGSSSALINFCLSVRGAPAWVPRSSCACSTQRLAATPYYLISLTFKYF